MARDVTIGELVREAQGALAAAPHGPPRREATLLVARVLGLGEAQVMARDDAPVAASDAARFRRLLARRVAGEPVAYLFGEREFYGRVFAVDRRVLVPRPETEHLVEAVLALELPPRPRLLDVGTGSGAIAVTLAAERPQGRVVATDLSLAALEVARANARRHGVAHRLRLVAADLTDAVRLAAVDVVAANPPYVATGDAAALSPEVTAWEPHVALFAGADGTVALARLLAAARALRPGAWMVLEIGHDQGEWMADRVAASRHLELRELRRDLAGKPRTAVLRRRP